MNSTTANVHLRGPMLIEVAQFNETAWVTIENVTFFPNHLDGSVSELLAEVRDWGQQIVDQASALLEKESHAD